MTGRQEFKDAASLQAFTVEDPDMSDYGRTLVHSFAGPFGADWELAAVYEAIDAAAEVRWVRGAALGHELVVIEQDGRRVWFDVKAPASPTASREGTS